MKIRYERTHPEGACTCRYIEITRESGELMKLELQTCPTCVTKALNYLRWHLTDVESQYILEDTHEDTSRSNSSGASDPSNLFRETPSAGRGHLHTRPGEDDLPW